MGSVASLKLPQGFCFSTPNQTHDLFLSFLNVLATSSATIFYSTTQPTATDPSTLNSIWVKTPENIANNTLEMFFYIYKYSGAISPTWCKYYPYAIGDIEYCNASFNSEDETETARSGKPNNRPFAVCDGGTYAGITTPNLTGKILYGGYCGSNESHPTDGTRGNAQIMRTLRDAAPNASSADLATGATQRNVALLNSLRMYQENNDAFTSYVGPDGVSPLLDPGESVTKFQVNGTIPTALQGLRKVILKRDQVPDHNHKYGWETWQTKGSCVSGSGGNAAISTNVSSTTNTTNTMATGSSTSKTLGRPHDNLPPVYVGTYRMYIGYGT